MIESAQWADSMKRKKFSSVESSKEVTTDPISKNKQEPASAFECDLCDKTFKTENLLKTHKTKNHKEEILRTPDPEPLPLKMSPVKEAPREKQCVCCGLPFHQCTRFKCGGCGIDYYNKEDSTNHELSEHPLMCHICFYFYKDIDSKQKHYVEKRFKI